MRFSVLTSLFAASVALALPHQAASAVGNAARATSANPSVNGLLFDIDGVSKYYAGTNAYWIGFLTNDSDVDLVMSHLATAGLKILRVWGFNDVNTVPSAGTVYYQSLVPGSAAVINTGPDGLQRLDAVVASAEAHGIKLIINFVNNWTDFGGMAAYLNWAENTSGNTDANNPSWYTNSMIQAQYQKYIAAVVSRYKTSSAVFAWELANESRCPGCATSVITDWATTTSAFIKSLDSTHMVTIGDEGFGLQPAASGATDFVYTYAEGTNFTANLAIKTIDFATLHLYPQSWGTTADWGNQWIADHGVACTAAGKPCILEEFGFSDTCSVESMWQATANTTRGIASDMFWQLGDDLSTGLTNNDGNAVYVGSDLWTCLVTNHVH